MALSTEAIGWRNLERKKVEKVKKIWKVGVDCTRGEEKKTKAAEEEEMKEWDSLKIENTTETRKDEESTRSSKVWKTDPAGSWKAGEGWDYWGWGSAPSRWVTHSGGRGRVRQKSHSVPSECRHSVVCVYVFVWEDQTGPTGEIESSSSKKVRISGSRWVSGPGFPHWDLERWTDVGKQS